MDWQYDCLCLVRYILKTSKSDEKQRRCILSSMHSVLASWQCSTTWYCFDPPLFFKHQMGNVWSLSVHFVKLFYQESSCVDSTCVQMCRTRFWSRCSSHKSKAEYFRELLLNSKVLTYNLYFYILYGKINTQKLCQSFLY